VSGQRWLTSAQEKNVVKGENLRLAAFIARGERELGVGPSGQHRTLASSQTGEASVRADFPYSSVTDGWSSVGVLNVARV
jgi:hypothetical protein